MKIYFGDIHNHCGMTYGFGSLQNALNNARSHLDFCAVTGHAFWPDIPSINEETEFLINFHLKGFQKLKDNYFEIIRTIKNANDEGKFSTFYSYEMHSHKYGDHHVVSYNDNLPLVEANSPYEWWEKLKDYQEESIIIPHHIAYTPNYRGIAWQEYKDNIFPIVEVCSKHGVSMSDKHSNNYYHTMGGRDSRNTVVSGLKEGKQFGFVGSTDHHAGYPGSYGDCCVGVLAKDNTRKSIMEALKARRTYALTADKIKCEFSVDNKYFGSINEFRSGNVEIKYNVEASDFIDKIIIYKGLRPIHIINGECLDQVNSSGEYKVRCEFGWGDNKDLYTWKINAKVELGEIIDIEKCFRGVSVLAPRKDESYNNDINLIDNHIDLNSNHTLSGQLQTVANYTTTSPATSSFIMTIKGDLGTKICLDANGEKIESSIGELIENSLTKQMGITNGQCFKMHLAVPETQYKISGALDDLQESPNFYYLEVYEKNGSCAFVSPVYFK